ncbi:Disease resistance protein RPM1 [Triticum urartu]|uniref:Disease resistance protein RPM1 n=1 Tax=Triticum urartu TaxID=4572 RepID=M8AJ65_TRIUA|nr:Disease resistance protein RPM1 [Triticum urartu]
MAEMAKGAVDSVLGTIGAAIGERAALMGSVRRDMRFIKGEMESMNGFLLDVDDPAEQSNQVQAWMRQVRDVAYESQSCIDRYVQTVGAGRSSAGLLGSVGRAPQRATAAREVLGDGDPENIADAAAILSKQGTEITDKEISAVIAAVKELLGFRRDPAKSSPAPGVGGPNEHKPGTGKKQAFIDALEILRVANTPTDVVLAEKQYSDQLKEWLRKLFDNELIEELVLGGWLHSAIKHAQENKYIEMAIERAPDALHSIVQAVKKVAGNGSTQEAPEKPGGDTDHVQGKSPGNDSVSAVPTGSSTVHDRSVVEEIMVAAQGAGKAAIEAISDGKAAIKSAIKTSDNSIIKPLAHSIENIESRVAWFQELLDHGGWRGDGGRPRLLAIVTPAADAHDPEEDGDRPATKLARTVYDMCNSGQHFDCVAWIDAKGHAEKTQRLRCLLQQVRPQSSSSGEDVSTLSDEQLAEEIRSQLLDKKFLIVMADPLGDEDEAPWADIASALPPWDSHSHQDCSGSTIIVTPMVQQPVQFHGWYLASWLFLLKASRYKVHFYSHLEATSKKANELLVGGHDSRELKSTVKRILQKCRHDTFSTAMFLHALYANPRRSENELLALLNQLQDVGSTARMAQEIIRFCQSDLSIHCKAYLHDLAMFQKHSSCKIRRGSSIRRWSAQNLISNRRQALDEAERGLNALVNRGLVLLKDPSPAGKAKNCELPPQVLTFVDTNTSSEDNIGNKDLPPELVPRLSVRNKLQLQQLSDGQQATHFSLCRRMLKCTTPADAEDYKDPLSVITFLNSLSASSQLGLIMVLDLEDCPGLNKESLKNICNKKFQLKYLSLRKTEVHELPKEIGKLQGLETLDIRETHIKSFPEAVVLQKLMHLLAGNVRSDESLCTVHIPTTTGSMMNIQVLSHVEASHSADVNEFQDVGLLKQLRKFGVVIPCNNPKAMDSLLKEIGKLDECLTSLSIHIKKAEDPHVPAPALDMNKEVISHPRSLESLNITGKISGLPTWIEKLHRLSKITLWRTFLLASQIGILGKLMNLRIVMLRPDSCVDPYLTFKGKEFTQLELLVVEVEGSQTIKISFDLTTAPKLEKIVWTSTSTTTSKEDTSSGKPNKSDMSGIDKLPSLRQIELNCSSFDMDRCSFNMESINRQICKNPNNPKLKPEELIPKDVVAAAAARASLIPDVRKRKRTMLHLRNLSYVVNVMGQMAICDWSQGEGEAHPT